MLDILLKVTNGCPQELILGSILFTIVINDLDTKDKCALIKCTDDIKMGEKWNIIQGNRMTLRAGVIKTGGNLILRSARSRT